MFASWLGETVPDNPNADQQSAEVGVQVDSAILRCRFSTFLNMSLMMPFFNVESSRRLDRKSLPVYWPVNTVTRWLGGPSPACRFPKTPAAGTLVGAQPSSGSVRCAAWSASPAGLASFTTPPLAASRTPTYGFDRLRYQNLCHPSAAMSQPVSFCAS